MCGSFCNKAPATPFKMMLYIFLNVLDLLDIYNLDSTIKFILFKAILNVKAIMNIPATIVKIKEDTLFHVCNLYRYKIIIK